jgi:hypothetical protein
MPACHTLSPLSSKHQEPEFPPSPHFTKPSAAWRAVEHVQEGCHGRGTTRCELRAAVGREIVRPHSLFGVRGLTNATQPTQDCGRGVTPGGGGGSAQDGAGLGQRKKSRHFLARFSVLSNAPLAAASALLRSARDGQDEHDPGHLQAAVWGLVPRACAGAERV